MAQATPDAIRSTPARAAAPSHKATSAEYGLEYHRQQAAKYRDRERNHWRARCDLCRRLVDGIALPRLAARGVTDPARIRVLDVGCSIGTFAIESAKRGFVGTGIDLDAEALLVARELAAEEGVHVAFERADVSAWSGGEGAFDIAIAFDIFEHLHDDELGGLLQAVRRCLAPGGTLVFHTFPTEFDYIFFNQDKPLWEPLLEHAALPPEEFERRTRAYAARLDAEYLESGGMPRREWIERWQHCNPLTQRRLGKMLARAGFEVLLIETAQLYPYGAEQQALFRGQPIADRNLYGAGGV